MRSAKPSDICDRKMLSDYLMDRLEEDERLSFLFHLDSCPNCWEAVYSATKAEHPHFYKRPTKKSKRGGRSQGKRRTDKEGGIFDVVA